MFGWLKPKPAPEPVNPGAALARMGHKQRRAFIRATADEMRARQGKPPVEWPAL
jgi:hypothetical protein